MFNKANIPMRCQRFEARFEDFLGGAPDSELENHLSACENCRAALDDSRLAGDLLREAWEPASEPSQAFLANVMARIHQEEMRAKSPAAFSIPTARPSPRRACTGRTGYAKRPRRLRTGH